MQDAPLPKIETLGRLHNALFMFKLTRHNSVGYILGLDRSPNAESRFVAHIYKGQYDDIEKPMCKRGYNRGKTGFSIFRNNYGKGICKTCLKNTLKELNK